MDDPSTQQQWVLLSYRLPREPSTARIATWRRLRKLGVAQIGDGLVALPYDARTKEHLEWTAAAVIEADGEAMVWVAVPGSHRDTEQLANQMRSARQDEYQVLIEEAAAQNPDDLDGRTLARLRRTLRDINRRDYFRAPMRDQARIAVNRLAMTTTEPAR
ncbi:MAG: chromate resistance protein [Actinomycetia bacterium]|nr:chromate resistance protein [Actinomycetes bacterium]MCP5033324.1 chromate resistance protein [Actinomycetes bacterium]